MIGSKIAIVLTCVSALYAYAVVPKHNGYSYHTVHEHKPHHHHHGGEEYHHHGGEAYHHHGGEEHHFEVHHSQPEYGSLGHGGYGGIVEPEHYGGGGGYAHHDEEHHDHHPQYKYDYGVHDHHTGDEKKAWESRDGDYVKGGYSLQEPDGTTRLVEYTSDKHNGFNAIVKKIGHAHHPQVYAKHEDHGYGYGGAEHGSYGGGVDHHSHGHATSYSTLHQEHDGHHGHHSGY